MLDWDPELYNRFRGYRAEPFHAILARLKLSSDERIIDLGCGSGENTLELARRSPHGSVLGIDSSPAMIDQADRLLGAVEPATAARVRFEIGDMAQLEARELYTLVISNSAIQWVQDHRAMFAACYRALVPDGRLVVQMPANHEETAQVELRRLASEEPWCSTRRPVAVALSGVGTPDDYRRMLGELGFVDIDCYYHTFDHLMSSPAEIVEWSRATALRPFVQVLPEQHRESFVCQWRARLERAYQTAGPLIFHFRRLFIWARRPANQDGA